MGLQKLYFKNASGQRLSGLMELPMDGKPRAIALFAHCFTCTKESKAAHYISRALSREGFGVMRFDFTGLGGSEGDFSDTNFSSNVSDIASAAEFLKTRFFPPQLLIGHSLGGAAIIRAAERIPSSAVVAVIGTPFDPSHVKQHIGEATTQILDRGEAEISLGGRPFRIKKQFLEDIETSALDTAVRNLNRALLVFHSPIDAIVGIEHAAKIFQTARHPKSFITLDKADHLLSNPEDARYVGTVIGALSAKYIRLAPEETIDEDHEASWIVTRTGRSGFATDISAKGHRLTADEPVSLGGTNLGPNPYDLLTAGLGACTGMTLRMYADRKQWPLESATVRLMHRKIHAGDCQDCDTETGMLDQIEREIELDGNLDDDQRRRLLDIADRCPVHRTLHGEIKIRTRLKENS